MSYHYSKRKRDWSWIGELISLLSFAVVVVIIYDFYFNNGNIFINLIMKDWTL